MGISGRQLFSVVAVDLQIWVDESNGGAKQHAEGLGTDRRG
jgi:hypothetical protein